MTKNTGINSTLGNGQAAPGKALQRTALCAGVAAAVLGAAPAQALSFGELKVNSALGRPLAATVPLRLTGAELINRDCVTLARPANAIAYPRNAQLGMPSSAGAGTVNLRITTSQPVYEPMYQFEVRVDCPGTPVMTRQYVAMLDLPGMASATSAPVAPATLSAAPQAASSSPAPAPATRRSVPVQRNSDPINPGSRYVVSSGDTLSTIAQRVTNRGGLSLWAMADQIFAANPAAFTNGDRNRIRAGVALDIPTPDGYSAANAQVPLNTAEEAPGEAAQPTRPPAARIEPDPVPEPAEAPATAVAADTGGSDEGAMDLLAAYELQAADSDISETVAPAAEAPEVGTDSTADTVVAEPAETTPEPVAEAPAEPAAPQPVTITSQAPATADGGTNPLLAILMGGLLGLILSLVLLRDRLFGRREEEAEEPAAPSPAPQLPEYNMGAQYADEMAEAEVEAATAPPSVAPTTPAPVAIEVTETTLEEDTVQTETLEVPSISDTLDVGGDSDYEETDFAELFDDVATVETAALPDAADDTPTMEAPVVADTGDSITAEMPANVEQLSRKLEESDDEDLSSTLTEALALLEQDYEDEFSASQIMDASSIADDLEKARKERESEES